MHGGPAAAWMPSVQQAWSHCSPVSRLIAVHALAMWLCVPGGGMVTPSLSRGARAIAAMR